MFVLQIIKKTLLPFEKSKFYGPSLPPEMQLENVREEIKVNVNSIYLICDHVFKFFSWCLILTIAAFTWRSTKFGLFLIILILMLFLLLSYIVIVSLFITYYVAKKAHKRKFSPRAIFVVAVLIGGGTMYIVPKTFFAGIQRLLRAQSCITYHKDSKNIPPECQKFVRM